MNRIKVFGLFLTFLFFFIVLTIKILNTHSTIFFTENNNNFALKVILPQSWPFFTKNPREPAMVLLQKVDSEWKIWRGIDYREDLFNFSRKPRILAREIGRLLDKIDTKNMVECKKNLEDCIQGSEENEIINSSKKPEICGPSILAFQEVTPWAWAFKKPPVTMPSKFLKVTINCQGGMNG